MLPSKGYFTNNRCLFYDAGSCDRPYCHFRHSKKGSLQDEEQEYIIAGAKVLESKIGPIKNFDKLVCDTIQDIHLNTQPNNQESHQATYSPTPITQLKNQNGENVRRHLPIHNTPYRPPIRPITKTNTTSSLLKFPYESSPSDTDTDTKSVQYIPTQNLSQLPTSTAYSYTPTSTGPRNGSSPVSTKEKYIPTDPSAKLKARKCQQYVPQSQNSEGTTPDITYQPTDINSIISNSNLDYSPNVTDNSTLNEHTYNPTKQATINVTTQGQPQPKPIIPTINDTDVGIIELDTDLDFINDILNDVKNDDDDSSGDKKKSKEKTKSSHHHHRSSSSSSKPKDRDKSTSKKDPKKESSSTKKESSSKSNSSSKSSSSKKDKDKTSSDDKKTSSSETRDEKKTSSSEIRDEKKTSLSEIRDEKKTSSSEIRDEKKTSSSETRDEKKTSSESKKESSENSISKKKDDKKDSERKDSDRKHSSSRNDKDKKESSSSSSSKKKSSSSHHHLSKSSKSSSSSSSKPSKHDKSPKHKSKSSSHHSSSHHSSSSSTSKSKHRSSSSSKSKASSSSDKNVNDSETVSKLITAADINMDDLDFSSDDDIEEQCRRIFEDSVNMPSVPQSVKRPPDRPNVEEEVPSKRQRVAHPSATTPSTRIKTAKPNFRAESSRLLSERVKISQQTHQLNLVFNPPTENTPTLEIPTDKPKMIRPANTQLIMAAPPNIPGKVRIAHVPNVSNLMNAKLKIPNAAVKKTIPQTTPKGKTRTMHAPTKMEVVDRPTVKDPENTKIPHHVRSVFLNNMIDACLDMYVNALSAYERARTEEFAVFDKCRSLPVYKQSAKLCVHRLQNLAKQSVQENNTIPDASSTSKISSRRDTNDENIYGQLTKYILTEEQLLEHGFPRPHPTITTNGAAFINPRQKSSAHKNNEYEKTCCRCHKVYKINEIGYPQFPEECIYHYKKRYRIRGEARYGCCGSSDDLGCISAPVHVFDDVDYENLRGYVETMDLTDGEEDDDPNRDYGVYALDCEMSYTTAGIELTRITVIDRKLEVVYETVVKPFHPIVDYNTRFSGIEDRHMEGVTTTLLDVQANLLHMFNNRTILIGHSLESDFKALKLIHNTVVDTSIMFPHRLGPPYKRALKNLAFDYLSKIIQNQVSGHDSAEDANACMELVLWKINEDKKL